MSLDAMFGFAVVSLVIAVSPGASWLYVISSTIQQGRGAGAMAIAGNATGILCHTVFAVVGLSALLYYSASLYTVIKWLGAIYLMYLAFQIIRTRTPKDGVKDTKFNRSLGRIYQQGVLINVLNPKVSLLMFALLPQFVDPAAGNAAAQIAVFGVSHAVIASCVLTLIMRTVSRAASWLLVSAGRERGFRWLCGSVLFGLGAYLALGERAQI